MNRKVYFRRVTAFFVLCLLLCSSVFASSVEVTPKKACRLTGAEFEDCENLRGIYIASLPSAELCTVRLGSRVLREGDVLDAACLSELSVYSTGLAQLDAKMEYRGITAEGLSAPQELSFHLIKAKDTVPVAKDGVFSTYKNISYTGKLEAADEDGDVLKFSIKKEPKRGTVDVSEDGAFVYTPKNNKVGSDSFTFTVTDPDGHVSEPARMEIKIQKPLDDARYADLHGTTDEFYAVWLRETGAYSGKTLGGSYVFEPNEPVSRGEFLVMAMNAFGQRPETEYTKTGFSDELSAPAFVRPYMAQALRSGYISGSRTEQKLVFRPDEPISFAEAAVMTQNIAKLPNAKQQAVFARQNDAIPAWANAAVAALSEAGVSICVSEDGSITRLACAKLLYEAANAKS